MQGRAPGGSQGWVSIEKSANHRFSPESEEIVDFHEIPPDTTSKIGFYYLAQMQARAPGGSEGWVSIEKSANH